MLRAAFGLAGIVALFFLWRFVRTPPERREEAAGMEERNGAGDEPVTLVPAYAPAPDGSAQSSRAAARLEGERSAGSERVAADDRVRAIVRGQLVNEQTGEPLHEQKLLLLSSEGNRVSESLPTDEFGAFTSTRTFPRGELRAWVKHPVTKKTLRRHAAPFGPERKELWLVPVARTLAPWELAAARGKAFVEARVVDLGGGPIAACHLRFVPEEGESALVSVESDELGELALELDPGRYRLGGGVLAARFERRFLALSVGQNDLGTLVVPRPSASASLTGTIIGPHDYRPPGVMILEEQTSGRELAVPLVTAPSGRFPWEPTAEVPFRIDGLVPGAYRVSILSSRGRTYTPTALEVVAPAEGLTFRASTSPPRQFHFVVHGSDGSRVTDFRILARVRGHWSEEGHEFLNAGPEEWIVLAPGHRPARGTFEATLPIREYDASGDAIVPVHVVLMPGHGAAYICLDVEGEGLYEYYGSGGGAPLAGVNLLADGQIRATSDEHGLLLLDAEHPPDHIEFEFVRPGWRLLERPVGGRLPQALFARQSP